MEQRALSLVVPLDDGLFQNPREDTKPVLGKERRQPIEHIVDRAVSVPVDLVQVALGYAALRELSRHCVNRRINRRRTHDANSLMLIAPTLLRLASMPCPKARETSSSTRLLMEAQADEWSFAARRCLSQSKAADAQALFPSRQTSRVPIGRGVGGGSTA